MIHITAQMRVLVAIESVDGRKGIDSLARVCQEKLSEDPFSGCVFIFRSFAYLRGRRRLSADVSVVGGDERGRHH
jgi:hypothetical protein